MTPEKRKYFQEYYEKNKEKKCSYQKEYRKQHREQAREAQKKWRQENKERVQEYSHDRYHQRKEYFAEYRKSEQRKTTQKNSASRRRELLAEIKLRYGCVNPLCQWQGQYTAELLDFHHKNADTKTFQLGSGLHRGLNKVIEEINKCVVLCANCHRMSHYGTLDVSNLPLCVEELTKKTSQTDI